MIRLFLSLALSLFIALHANAVAVDEKKLDDPVLEARARELMKEIRCLVCQNQSIEDSNADLAKDLRRIVREQIGAGKSEEDIRTFLVERYGDWVMLSPPVDSRTWFLWASPVVFLLLIGFLLLKRGQKTAPRNELTAEEEARVRALIQEDTKQ